MLRHSVSVIRRPSGTLEAMSLGRITCLAGVNGDGEVESYEEHTGIRTHCRGSGLSKQSRGSAWRVLSECELNRAREDVRDG